MFVAGVLAALLVCLSGARAEDVPACTPLSAELTILMTNAGGDGWGGNTMSISDCRGLSLAQGITLDAGATGTATVCLPVDSVDAGLVFEVLEGGGVFMPNIRWTVTLEGTGEVLATGACPDRQSTCAPSPCPQAFNGFRVDLADPAATAWHGNALNVLDCGGQLLYNTTLADEDAGAHSFCLRPSPDDAYVVMVDAGAGGGGGGGDGGPAWLFRSDVDSSPALLTGTGAPAAASSCPGLSIGCFADDVSVSLALFSQSGHGWRGVHWSMRACEGQTLRTNVTMDPPGLYSEGPFCVPASALGEGFSVRVGGAPVEPPGSLSWSLRSGDGPELSSGGAPAIATACTEPAVPTLRPTAATVAPDTPRPTPRPSAHPTPGPSHAPTHAPSHDPRQTTRPTAARAASAEVTSAVVLQ